MTETLLEAPPVESSGKSDMAGMWRVHFESWPQDIPRQGVLVTNLNEQIPFVGFMVSPQMLLLERRNPDTVGARNVIIPFENINTLKLVDVLRDKQFKAAGFQGAMNK